MKSTPWAFPLVLLFWSVFPLQATMLVPFDCTGQNTPDCPGFVENFTGSPGTFLTGSTQTLNDLTRFNVTLTAAVFRNPNGVTLDFYYQLRTNSEGTSGLAAAEMYNFGAFRVDAGVRKDAFGSFGTGAEAVAFAVANADALTITRTLQNPGPTGPQVIFGFSGFDSPDSSVLPGQTSPTLIVKTDATEYTSGRVFAVPTSGAVRANTLTFAAFQPTAAVPEPSTVWCLGPLFGSILALRLCCLRAGYPRSGSRIAGQSKRSVT